MKLVLAAALGAVIGSACVAQAETTLILGEAGPNRGARAQSMNWFAEKAGELSGGDLKFDIQWGGALFKAGAALSGVADGVADLGTVISVYFPQEMVAYGIADLPLKNDDAWVGMKATNELMQGNASIRQNLADMNLVYIGTFTTSAVHIGCKDKAIRSIGDISGLKVRGVGAYGDTFKDVGANLVPMSVYDAYQGLDSGLLDCSQGYSYATAALKQHEVITSYTLLNWGQVGALGILMNKDMFDSLSPENQQALLSAGDGIADELGRLITADNAKAIETMKAAGVEVIELPEADRAQLIEGGQKYVDAWVERASAVGLDGAALLNEYKGLIAKYEAERDEKGYPWMR
ncbi:C4-dicarboxylate TRAP transporter substrate-binding protein [Roseibium sp.]|uniref:C4-dicarboxylate TRAP transporter substrate-binding protein n=1 Tax=Roseibium sp. TaxID=1936156 RepID=UPI003A97963E